MQILNIIGYKDPFENWLENENYLVFLHSHDQTEDYDENKYTLKALRDFYERKGGDIYRLKSESPESLLKSWRESSGNDKISLARYLMYIKNFLCLVIVVDERQKPLEYHTVGSAAVELKISRQRVAQLVEDIPGAVQLLNKRRSWIIPRSGVDYLKTKLRKK